MKHWMRCENCGRDFRGTYNKACKTVFPKCPDCGFVTTTRVTRKVMQFKCPNSLCRSVFRTRIVMGAAGPMFPVKCVECGTLVYRDNAWKLRNQAAKAAGAVASSIFVASKTIAGAGAETVKAGAGGAGFVLSRALTATFLSVSCIVMAGVATLSIPFVTVVAAIGIPVTGVFGILWLLGKGLSRIPGFDRVSILKERMERDRKQENIEATRHAERRRYEMERMAKDREYRLRREMEEKERKAIEKVRQEVLGIRRQDGIDASRHPSSFGNKLYKNHAERFNPPR